MSPLAAGAVNFQSFQDSQTIIVFKNLLDLPLWIFSQPFIDGVNEALVAIEIRMPMCVNEGVVHDDELAGFIAMQCQFLL